MLRSFLQVLAFFCTLFLGITANAADNATYVSQSVPTVLTSGEVRAVSVTMRNTGTTVWTPAGEYKLGSQAPQDTFTWGDNRVYMAPGEAIPVNGQKTFTFNITAPSAPGTYTFQWRMVHDGIAWFGAQSPAVSITVQPRPALDSQFVSQSVPTSLPPGQTASVSVTMRNTGTNVWTAAGQYRLGSQAPQDTFTWGDSRVYMVSGEAIAPNAQKTFTFTITAPATAGVYTFQWKMLQEYVAWFGAQSPAVSITVSQPAVTLCPGESGILDGTSNVGPALQRCINATPPGGTLELPAGTYGIGTLVSINKPFTLRTQGLAGSTTNCEGLGNACAVLKALPTFSASTGGFIAAEATSNVTFDHLVLDGNRVARLGTAAASNCASGVPGANIWGFNARMSDCASCRFTNSVSKNTLCGTALEFRGNDGTLVNNVFRSNGQNSQPGMWADGLTIHASDRALVDRNAFIDNSDVALILGSGRQAVVTNNSITQPGQVTFAGLMLDNFNNSFPGDFTGAIVTGNTINCSSARNCHFGINLGPHPWYSGNNILGGSVYGNTVVSARQGINVDGAGTAAAPLLLYGNTVTSPSPGSASFLCGTHATSALNINTADSVVNRNGDTAPMTSFEWHDCP
ncbi:NBR1-Ig-like domain-containing protein [Corallococcus carmarthensis]|uniref:Next to BRCA1 central domain-containing protein n=1 Tax=Corallococcus carmarthensis TaxID=2316728 RepID=A0A3A8KFW0_9BACT|nr:NBR1-Ig-like domain-containing protein [Corallococcus carmarthensis]RKH07033.1 hypothetical protein D7X32_02870 [Corallococcus carmarthensis]